MTAMTAQISTMRTIWAVLAAAVIARRDRDLFEAEQEEATSTKVARYVRLFPPEDRPRY